MNLSPAQLNSGRDKQYYSRVWLTNKLGNNETFSAIFKRFFKYAVSTSRSIKV